MKDENYAKGKRGEEIAQNHLVEKGWQHLESNYHNSLGEIDLVMVDGAVLVFVEVKLKTGEEFGRPEEMITPGKLRQVRRVAESYLTLRPTMAKKYKSYRIDAICIVMKNKSLTSVNHYENIEM